jgi:23S rRNA (guanosine2251-2'-O)-methyltransferase
LAGSRKKHFHHRPAHGARSDAREGKHGTEEQGAFWLYGLHAARAALKNPARKIRRAVLTPRAADELSLRASLSVERVEPDKIARLLPPGAVHQGVALLCEPLPSHDLDRVLGMPASARRIVAVLDQVTDPHNEGAILRSASAFGLAAVIVQDRHAPPESGALAKAASGALDIVPRIVVVNIARALEELARLGFWRIALAGDGDVPLAEAGKESDLALVLGAEGSGLRRLVRERCDISASIPLTGGIESLNVSNAAAIAFYEFATRQRTGE